AEGALTTALGSQVELGAVHLLYGPSIAIEARDLSAWPSAWGPALRVDRAYVTVHWLDLVFGQIDLQRVELEGLSLRIQRRQDGGFEPRALAEWLSRSQPARATPSSPFGRPCIACVPSFCPSSTSSCAGRPSPSPIKDRRARGCGSKD